jgi:predicted acylesterase/phospholipase RssA
MPTITCIWIWIRRRGSMALSLAILPHLVLVAAGCSFVHVYSASNHPWREAGAPPATRATLRLADAELARDVFVGIAMSGGGSRAANFSAATLLELETLGFLKHATAISAVSGSSLTAAYYGLYGRNAQHWNSTTVRERFAIDFETQWIVRWFNPWNIVRYWFTDFDRSDIMKTVFDTYLFRGRRQTTFGDMGAGRPKILINATSLPQSGPFVFTDETFVQLGSRLDQYPLSHAVMASGAFPGAFHNVTLEDFRRPGYFEHLFDGGPGDNLGVHTLLRMIDATKPRSGCFIFIVDAFPYKTGAGEKQSDTRRVLDFFVDHNALDSADVFLTLRRYDTLQRRLNYCGKAVGEIPQWTFTTDGGVTCEVWHLTFQSLEERSETRTTSAQQARENLRREVTNWKKVNLIPTLYRLKGPEGMKDAREVQGLVFGVAQHLLRDDDDALPSACAWFNARQLSACEQVQLPPSSVITPDRSSRFPCSGRASDRSRGARNDAALAAASPMSTLAHRRSDMARGGHN